MKIKLDIFLRISGLLIIVGGAIFFGIFFVLYNHKISDNIVYALFISGYSVMISGILIDVRQQKILKK